MKFSSIALVSALSFTACAAFADSHEAPVVDLVAAALSAGDIDAGERVFKKCKACHQVGEGAAARVGPPLNNIVGAVLASDEGFNYSNTFVEMRDEGTAWTLENLDVYLLKPRDFVDGTKMTFSGLRDEEDRTNVIAYLASLTEVSE